MCVCVCVCIFPQDKLSKNVNMRAMNMLGKTEEKVRVILCGCTHGHCSYMYKHIHNVFMYVPKLPIFPNLLQVNVPHPHVSTLLHYINWH